MAKKKPPKKKDGEKNRITVEKVLFAVAVLDLIKSLVELVKTALD